MKSIRFKLWAGMMTLIVIVLILLWLFQIVFLESFYTGMRISEVKNKGMAIVKLLDDDEKDEFTTRMDTFAFHNNLSVELVDLKGNTVYITGNTGSSGQMPMMKNNARVEVLQEALTGKEATATVIHPRFGNKLMMIGLPIRMSGELSGAVLINMPLAPVEDTAAILKRQLLYITLILLAASLLISFLISRSFTSPILEIKKASEIMAAGDFSARIESKKQDEIGKLAETINYMGEQLSKIEQLRKDLIANVSHELRTPLSLIRGYAETMRDVTGNYPEKREKQLGIIIEETERLSKIVDDILNLSQLQAGYFKLNKSHFEICQLLDTVVKRYDIISERTGIEVVRIGSSNAVVEADETRIGQVLYNLINNGFNHTPEGGKITIKMMDNEETVKIEISDTGKGISPEELPHIWERYYKSQKTGDRKTTGTGLGLAIVKGVLKAHEVAFGVESKENEGTTFWFELKKAVNKI